MLNAFFIYFTGFGISGGGGQSDTFALPHNYATPHSTADCNIAIYNIFERNQHNMHDII